MMRIDALPLLFFSTIPSPSSSSWPVGHLSIPPHAGAPKAAARGASCYGGWGHISDDALCAMSGHNKSNKIRVDALGDVVVIWWMH
jgi:hypothetical protein